MEEQQPPQPPQAPPPPPPPPEQTQYADHGGQNMGMELTLPNSTAALILGIISIPTCICCYGVIGLIMGILATVLGGKAMKTYNENPDLYTDGSFSNAKAGRTCGIIGIVLSTLVLVTMIILLALGILTELQQEMMDEFYNDYY